MHKQHSETRAGIYSRPGAALHARRGRHILAGIGPPLTSMLRASPDSCRIVLYVSICTLWWRHVQPLCWNPTGCCAQQLLMCPQHCEPAMRTVQQHCGVRMTCSEHAMHKPMQHRNSSRLLWEMLTHSISGPGNSLPLHWPGLKPGSLDCRTHQAEWKAADSLFV